MNANCTGSSEQNINKVHVFIFFLSRNNIIFSLPKQTIRQINIVNESFYPFFPLICMINWKASLQLSIKINAFLTMSLSYQKFRKSRDVRDVLSSF